MDDNLLGYLLGSLDEATHAQVEAYLDESPQARGRLENLRRALAPLADDRDGFEAPLDLSTRTLALIAEHCCRELPRSPRPNVQPCTGGRSLWRRLDVVIAASILFVAVSLVFPGIAYLRHRQARVLCANNLKDFHAAIQNYQAAFKEPPRFDRQAKPPNNVVGWVAPMLRDKGLLTPVALSCPESGQGTWCNLSVQQINNLSPKEFQEQAPQFLPSYAYSLGYYDETGEYHFPAVPANLLASAVPLMADRPPAQVQVGNSPNHGGSGQNVLFHDGSVLFLTGRKILEDDIYLNDRNEVASGLSPFDTVLAVSQTPP